MKTKKAILRKAKTLASEYYELTRKPLGVTGEVAEFEAAEKLSLELTGPRTTVLMQPATLMARWRGYKSRDVGLQRKINIKELSQK